MGGRAAWVAIHVRSAALLVLVTSASEAVVGPNVACVRNREALAGLVVVGAAEPSNSLILYVYSSPPPWAAASATTHLPG